jgi:hypothetical protein
MARFYPDLALPGLLAQSGHCAAARRGTCKLHACCIIFNSHIFYALYFIIFFNGFRLQLDLTENKFKEIKLPEGVLRHADTSADQVITAFCNCYCCC